MPGGPEKTQREDFTDVKPALLPSWLPPLPQIAVPSAFSTDSFALFVDYTRLWRIFPDISRRALHTLLCACGGSLARAVDNVLLARTLRAHVWREAARRGLVASRRLPPSPAQPLPPPLAESPPTPPTTTAATCVRRGRGRGRGRPRGRGRGSTGRRASRRRNESPPPAPPPPLRPRPPPPGPSTSSTPRCGWSGGTVSGGSSSSGGMLLTTAPTSSPSTSSGICSGGSSSVEESLIMIKPQSTVDIQNEDNIDWEKLLGTNTQLFNTLNNSCVGGIIDLVSSNPSLMNHGFPSTSKNSTQQSLMSTTQYSVHMNFENFLSLCSSDNYNQDILQNISANDLIKIETNKKIDDGNKSSDSKTIICKLENNEADDFKSLIDIATPDTLLNSIDTKVRYEIEDITTVTQKISESPGNLIIDMSDDDKSITVL